MRHTIKIDRATRQAKIGSTPRSTAAMLAWIPRSVLSALTSAQLAELIDAMYGACQEAKGIAEQAAVDQGCVWDARRQQMRDLVA